MQQPFGILNLDKPVGMTSRKVVDRVARLVRPAKAGHAGTLDPLATGVLLVCVGPATRLTSWLQKETKEYQAHFLLGCTSETDDLEGSVAPTPHAKMPIPRERIEEVLPRFLGSIEQVPPKFSAVHVAGRRAYKLARKGKTVELNPRTVHVERIEILHYEYPELALRIVCGSGTYIRSIARDLGDALGCGAVMAALERTRVGEFSLETSLPVGNLASESVAAHLIPAVTAVSHLPRVKCDSTDLIRVRNGGAIPAVLENIPSPSEVAIVDADGELAALAEYLPESGIVAPRQVFPVL